MPARRPNGSKPIPVRTLRVPDKRWEKSKRTARKRGETLSAALNRFLDCYNHGGDVNCEHREEL